MDASLSEIDTSNNNASDYAAIILKGLAGAIPIGGSLFAEVIGNAIRNQRIDRIDKYLHVLAAKVSKLEEEILRDRLLEPEFINLLEDSLYQAARAPSEERIGYIASLVSNSLLQEQVDYIRYTHILSLLDEINDVEVLIVQYYSLHPPKSEEFRQKHEIALSKPPAVSGSSLEDLDKSTVSASYREHLTRLGLLKIKFRKPKKGELPEFDERTGMIKAQGYDIAPLGRLLLRYIELEEKGDELQGD